MGYVNNDPVGWSTDVRCWWKNDQTHFSSADIFEPQPLLNDANVCKYLDFSKPIASFQLADAAPLRRHTLRGHHHG